MTVDPVHELEVECRVCGQQLIVGGFVDDLDPALYVCLQCRPFKAEQRDPRAGDLAGAIARARAAQNA